jgi:uncharacterized repeat protein (TIGR01451 family)
MLTQGAMARLAIWLLLGLLMVVVLPARAATLDVTPITWNVVGLDSNNVNVGPNDFPVGARVCNTSGSATTATVNFNWTTSNTYINLRPGTLSSLSLSLNAGQCKDAYFEVEVTRDSAAYNTTRGYTITASDGSGTASTPSPREIYVERLVSQSRNATTDMQLSTDGGATYTSIPAGGTMNLMVGQTYFIKLVGSTATNGYEQLESFINFPNTIFQVLSVSTTYTADSSTYVNSPNDKLYGDACLWDNDPTSPNYRSCLSTGKVGGNIVVTYQVKILSVPSAPLVNPEPLNTLVYDFSGSSYHYNADFSASTRYANIVNATLAKSFAPKTITPGGTSTLTFMINNPGPEPINSVNFTDNLPSGMSAVGGAVTSSGCGTPSPSSLTGGTTSLSFSDITVAGLGTCTISLGVTATTAQTYNNTTSSLKVGTADTGSTGSDSLVVSTNPNPPSSCSPSEPLAIWNLENYTASTATNNGPFNAAVTAADVSFATGSYGSLTGSQSGIANPTTFPTGWNSAPATTGNSGNSWGISGAWLAANPSNPAAAATPYFQFSVDVSNYGGIGISASYNLQGNWSNSGNFYVLFSTDGATWTAISTGAWSKANAWQINAIPGLTTTSPNTTVYFRVFFAGAQYSGNPSTTNAIAYLDNITIFGCPRPKPPTLAKSFSPTTIAQGSSSTLTFTVANPNGSALTGVGFSDTLPTGLSVTDGTVSACGGTVTTTAATRTIALTGGTLAASGTCSFSVAVTGSSAGVYTNISSPITSTQSGPNTTGGPNVGYGQAGLTVIAPPVISKSFGANSILTNGTTTLSFSITNPNIATGLTGVNFSDILPSGLSVATPNGLSGSCGGGTITAAAGASTVSLSGATLAAGASCTFSVNVTGTTTGLKPNSVTVSSTNGGTGNTATASVLVRDPNAALAFRKQVAASPTGPWFSYQPVAIGASVYYRFTVENTGDVALTQVVVTDPSLNPFTCTWQYVVVSGSPPTETLTAYSPQSPLTIPAPSPSNEQHIAYCVPNKTVTALSGVHTNTARVDTSNPLSATDSAEYEGKNPTAVDMGQVDLVETSVSDLLRGIGADKLDAAALLALLRTWDPAAAVLEGADREALLAALRDYLDPDGDGRVVVLRWETLEERGTIGFYAERRRDGAWARINAAMLPGLIAAPMGAEYWLADPGAGPGEDYQYRLIEVEARGTTREYGPFDLRIGNQ